MGHELTTSLIKNNTKTGPEEHQSWKMANLVILAHNSLQGSAS